MWLTIGAVAFLQVAEHNIRVTNVYPGSVQTGILNNAIMGNGKAHGRTLRGPEWSVNTVCAFTALHQVSNRTNLSNCNYVFVWEPDWEITHTHKRGDCACLGRVCNYRG